MNRSIDPKARALPLLAVTMLAAGCGTGDAPPSPPDASRTDTATWTLDAGRAVPLAPDRELFRVHAGVLAADGSAVVGNGGAGELLFFAPDGTLRSAAGREGDGPGEHRSIGWVARLPGDSLLVFDLRANRFGVWTPDGRFARAFTAATPTGRVFPAGLLADGSILVTEEMPLDPRTLDGPARSQLRVHALGTDGAVRGSFGAAAGPTWLRVDAPGAFRLVQHEYGPRGIVLAAATGPVHVSTDGAALRRLGPAGAGDSVPLPVRPRPLARDEAASRLAGMLEGRPAAEADAIRRAVEAAGPVRAGFSDAWADGAGRIWLAVPRADGPVKWWVLSSDGAAVGSIWLPAGARPLAATDDRLLLRETDASGEERVRVYPLRR